MSTQVDKDQPKQNETTQVRITNNEDLDFELWATEVRQQLLASLRKRGNLAQN